ncbi:hypothetical protein UFOVP1414_8 [uncultured Caudovirales phage]|uniref:Uncharacterized protein n=1 Tax=uncultured Caudovirales phage TaxID=2100421 RepID=A0A6J5SEA7_9CAUD|nr:hypothetical protein UFOVP442_69 [uncultured Caudovirales phage]CAB4211724.1 hypothetical protein UFOVP1414_8 [uncultured Caudovirales phage]
MPRVRGITMPKRENVESIRVRQIENGYIVSKETYTSSKGFECREVFTDKRPDLSIAGLKPRDKGGASKAPSNSLTKAFGELKKK